MAQGYYPNLKLKLKDEPNNFSSSFDLSRDIEIEQGYYPTGNIKLTGKKNNFSNEISLKNLKIEKGYLPTGNIDLKNEVNNFSNNIELLPEEKPVIPPTPAPTVIAAIFGSKWQKANDLSSITKSKYEKTRVINSNIKLPIQNGKRVDERVRFNIERDFYQIDNGFTFNFGDNFNKLNICYTTKTYKLLMAIDKTFKIAQKSVFVHADSGYNLPYSVPPTKDVDYTFRYNHVVLDGIEREFTIINPPDPNGGKKTKPYKPTLDIQLKDEFNTFSKNLSFGVGKSGPGYIPIGDLRLTNDKLKKNGNLNLFDIKEDGSDKPDKPVIVYKKTPIQPTGTPFLFNFKKSLNQVDIDKTINWGYGLNNFVIGGITRLPSKVDEDVKPPEPHEPIKHKDYGVYRIVNIVNIKLIPTGEIIHFDNFTISRDIDSFAWTATFDVLDRASYNLIKPEGRTLKNVEININGKKFVVFIGKSSTSRKASSNGAVSEVFKTTGWSRLKMLSNPYSRKRSFTDSQARTAAQIATNELTGTGFDVEWNTIDWLIPLGVHSYQDKTPIGAILSLVNSIGGVIEPYSNEDKFKVKPYYPVSPWNWDKTETQIDREMNETQFFTIDSETVPKENPDGVFIYGEEKGVGVKAVRQGKPGSDLLPDVVDKYITANTAGQERGRQEVAKNSFIEKIPMTTYIDENGIIMPQELIEFTTPEGDKWRGMVLQTSVACQRIGTALAQQITVARFFDD